MAEFCIAVPVSLTGSSVSLLRTQLVAAAQLKGGTLVLRGEGDRFCAGMAFDAVEELDDAGRASGAFAECLELLRRFPGPVVAMVTGEATGGGVGIAAAADLVIASERATFALSEVLFGLVPAIVTPPLLGRLSPSRMKLWAMMAERWDAGTAREYGLVDVVVAHGEAEKQLASCLRRFERADAGAVAELKQHVSDLAAGRASDGVEITTRRLGDADVRNRIVRFMRDGVAPWTKSDQ